MVCLRERHTILREHVGVGAHHGVDQDDEQVEAVGAGRDRIERWSVYERPVPNGD